MPPNPAGFPVYWASGSNPESTADYEVDPEIANDLGYQSRLLNGLKDIPTLSVVLDVDDMFSNGGLYWHRDTREKPVSAELIFGNGKEGFQINCGMRVQGGASRQTRKSPKHALSLRFRDIYGPGELDYPLFEGSSVDHFDTLQLRSMYNNSWIHWDSGQRGRGFAVL